MPKRKKAPSRVTAKRFHDYEKTLEIINDVLVAAACGLEFLTLNKNALKQEMEELACFIRLVLNGQTFEQAKALLKQRLQKKSQ